MTVAVAAALVAAVALLGVGYSQRGAGIGDLRSRLASERSAAASARVAAASARVEAARAEAASTRQRTATQAERARYLAAQHRLLNPRMGRIPRHAEGSLSGWMDQLAPTGARITALEPLPPTATVPERVAVAWTGPQGELGLPESGILLWQAVRQVSPGTGLYDAIFDWRVIYGWHFGADSMEYVGPPGQEKPARSDLISTISSFSVGDLTGDGYPELLVGTDPQGSGGCIAWRVLSTSSGATRTIFHRVTCDTGISISGGRLLIDAATHRPGCNIHGCGDRRHILLRWSGSGWAVTSRTLVGTPYATSM